MKKKLIALLSILMSATLAMGFVACGENEEASSSPSSSTSAPDSSSPSSAPDSSSSSNTDDDDDGEETETYTITFNTNGGSAVTSVEVTEGASVDFSNYVTEKADATFVGWYQTGSSNYSEPLETKAVYENMEVTAMYTNELFQIGNSKYIYFGAYPQSRITDEALISVLSQKIGTEIKGSCEHEGKQYVKETYLGGDLHDEDYFADGTALEKNKAYYFEVEPILWSLSGLFYPNGSVREGQYSARAVSVIDAGAYEDYDFDAYTETTYYDWGMDFWATLTTTERSLLVNQATSGIHSVYVKAVTEDSYKAGLYAQKTSYTDYSAVKSTPMLGEGTSRHTKYWLYTESGDGDNGLPVGQYWNQSSTLQTEKIDGEESVGYLPTIILDLRKSVTLTFDTNNGSAVEPQTLKEGETFEATTTRAGYEFGGWYQDEALTTAITKVPSQNTTVYAKWNPITYDITYDTYWDHMASNDDRNPVTFTKDDTTAFYTPTAKTGTRLEYYTFEGWYTESTYENKVQSPVDLPCDDVTLYQRWIPTEYAITYELNGGTNDTENPATFNVDDTPFTLKNATKTDSAFAGWYLESDFQTKVTELKEDGTAFGGNGVKAITLYAKFATIQTYNDVTYQASDDDNGVIITGVADATKTSLVVPASINGKNVVGFANNLLATTSPITDMTITFAENVDFSNLTAEDFVGLTNLQNVTATAEDISALIYVLPNKTLKQWTAIATTDTTLGTISYDNSCTIEKIIVAEGVTGMILPFNQNGVKSLYFPADFVVTYQGFVGSSVTTLEEITIPNFVHLGSNLSYIPTACRNTLKRISAHKGWMNGGSFNMPNVEEVHLGKEVGVGTPTNQNKNYFNHFYKLSKLKTITVDSENSVFSLSGTALLYNGELAFTFDGTFPQGVTEIAEYATVASGVTELIIPEGVTAIPYSFATETGLNKVVIPSSVNSISISAFANWGRKTLVTYGGALIPHLMEAQAYEIYTTNIPDRMFTGQRVQTVSFGKAGTVIGANAFAECANLTNIDFANVSSVGNYAFYKCNALQNVDLKSVETLGAYAFAESKGLTSVNLSTLTGVSDYAFFWCSNLSTATGTNVQTVGECAFGLTKIASFDFSKLTTIKDAAFSGTKISGEIVLPATLTSIGKNAFESLTGITAIKFAGTQSTWESIVGGAVVNGSVGNLQIDYYCNGALVTSTTSGNGAFACSKSLTSVDLSDWTGAIADGAFRNCTLTAITLGSGVTSIGANAFNNCQSLTTINFMGTVAEWNALQKGKDWNKNVSTTVTIACSDGNETL